MTQKQSFADFLTSGSPYGGKNRGRAGSSRGRGGGGRGGFYGNASKKAYNADYSNVPFDYETINSQHYKKLEREYQVWRYRIGHVANMTLFFP